MTTSTTATVSLRTGASRFNRPKIISVRFVPADATLACLYPSREVDRWEDAGGQEWRPVGAGVWSCPSADVDDVRSAVEV